MDKTFQPRQLEERWYRFWEERGYFAPSETGEPYAIAIPPPNITGRLHMGHGFQHAIMDALIRYHRMLGHAALWQVGTDHAGIATQMVVEQQLLAAGSSRAEIGREAFIRKVWDWKAESGGIITRQLRRLGSSLDWSRERFTMDDDLCQVVETAFIQLYDEGLIYRGHRLVNWDPTLHTAISDLEVNSEEEDGSLWHFRYPLADGIKTTRGDPWLVVATTRPETMLGDTAVAVHPEDERYRDLVGKQIELPLAGRRLPIIADDYVDREFGTGCVKITPAHDFNDYDMGLRHGLDIINIFTADAALNDNAPPAYRGLDRLAARAAVVKDLDALGLLDGIKPHRLKVPRGDRSGDIIEPYLTTQWYVAVKSLAEPAIAAVENGAIEFVPRNWENTYFSWLRDIQDWCISRQLWWGHRIPAWHDDEGHVYVGRSEQDARARNGLDGKIPLRRDEDVLDTWFSSALWTFSTLGWQHDDDFFRRFHPTSVLVTGFDIIFFWVARMIMMTLKFTGEVPFRKVYVTGLVRDENGQKMSKSKGNILDPIDLIDGISLEELLAKRTADMMQPQLREQIERRTRASFPDGIAAYGTDALRYTFYSLASTGRDIKFDVGRIEGFRNFCNKIWNAARYVLLNTEGRELPSPETVREQLSAADRWIASRWQRTARAVREAMADYRFDLVAAALHKFIWDDYCDWYLELTKPVLWDEASPAADAARVTLLDTLEKSLRLLHPFMPFITEEAWQRIAPLAGRSGESIMIQPYPVPVDDAIDEEAEKDIAWLQGIIMAIRNVRGEMDISPARELTLLLRKGCDDDRRRMQSLLPLLRKLAKLGSVEWLATDTEPPPAAVKLLGELEILLPMAGLIDVEAERARLDREIAKLRKMQASVEGKLANPSFLAKAPAAVVAKERERAQSQDTALKLLEKKRAQLEQS